MSHRHRVVIVGAGFGGLNAAKALAKSPVDVTLVDANNFHTFQPLLYQVATAGLDGDDIASAVRGIFHRQRNVDFRLATATGADLDERRLLVEPGPPIEYDTLVVAAGAVTATYDIPGVSEYAFGLKSLADAQRLRTHVLLQFELAATDDRDLDEGGLTVVVAGGGPTGVELAGGLHELFSMVLAKDYPRLDVRRARVVLVEMADRVLGTFAPRLSTSALRTLRARGIEVVLGVGVDKVEPGAVHLSDGTRIATRTLVWTAGVKASPLGATLGLPTARGGRVAVGADLAVDGHREVFVIGDLAGSVDASGQLLPQVAPVAIQGGRHVARQIERRLNGEPTTGFRYRDKGSMATIGRRAAVAQLPGGIRFAGTLGWVSWLALHLVMLIGFRNRANVLVNWAWNYVTYDRGSRLIVAAVDAPDATMAPPRPPTPAEPPSN